jgi:hypothetical protein
MKTSELRAKNDADLHAKAELRLAQFQQFLLQIRIVLCSELTGFHGLSQAVVKFDPKIGFEEFVCKSALGLTFP